MDTEAKISQLITELGRYWYYGRVDAVGQTVRKLTELNETLKREQAQSHHYAGLPDPGVFDR